MVILIGLLFVISSLHGQRNHGINWVTGRGNTYKMHFKQAVPFVSEFDFNFNFYFRPGTSCISDSNGAFRLICNTCQLYDSTGSIIEGGDSITPKGLCNWFQGSILYAQASIILPLGNNKYSVVTAAVSDSVYNLWQTMPYPFKQAYDILQQHVVDMNLNGGLGKVISKKMILQDVPLSRTQMMACRHADGKSWWLLKQGKDSNRVYKFIITADSIYNYGSQFFQEPRWGNLDERGQTMFAHKGNLYATTAQGTNSIFIADFDRCNGQLTNERVVSLPLNVTTPADPAIDSFPWGLCFSPNDSFLYVVTAFNLYQLDLYDTNVQTAWYHVANMDTTFDQFQQWNTLYPSPDGRIFIGNRNGLGKAMSTIENPNVKGSGCNFCPKCFRFGLTGAGNPPCMPNYALGKDTTLNCWPMGLGQVKQELPVLNLYPNPASSSFIIESVGLKQGRNQLQVYNLMGQLLLQEYFVAPDGKHQVAVDELPAGVYMVRVNGVVRRLIIE